MFRDTLRTSAIVFIAESAMFRGFFWPGAVISSPEGYAVVVDSGYCSCPFSVRQNTPVCIVQGSAYQLVSWNNRHRYFYARLYWTKYARADFVETVSGGERFAAVADQQ